MKSRTSFFNGTVFKKDVTRFFPLWALYLIGGCLVMLTATMRSDPGMAARTVGRSLYILPIVNLVYAPLAAMLLFGDLHKSRMCNALHALPIRREGWFFSHVAAGLSFSIVPNLVGVLLLLPRLGEFWYVGFLWLLAMTLQYLFYFGVAVLAIMVSGNRTASLAIYGILNFGSQLVYWFLASVYLPSLYGIVIPQEPFHLLCPTEILVGDDKLLRFEYVSRTNGIEGWQFLGLGENWSYLVWIAVIGALFLVLALALYRKRHLETAGDFIAWKPIQPVFSVGYTLCFGAMLSVVGAMLDDVLLVFLVIGLTVGWFTGQMLLKRTVRVFQLPVILKGAAIVIVMVISIFAAQADIFGVVRYVPQKEQVTQVTIIDPYSYDGEATLVCKEKEDIQTVLSLHQTILKHKEKAGNYASGHYRNSLKLIYTLNDGTQRTREYDFTIPKEDGQDLRTLLSRPEAVLGEALTGQWTLVECEGYEVSAELYDSLRQAILADCQEGNMAQDSIFHSGQETYIHIRYTVESGNIGYKKGKTVRVYGDSQHTLAWVKANFQVDESVK